MLQVETIRKQIAKRRLRAEEPPANPAHGLPLRQPISRRTLLVASAAGSAALPMVAEAATGRSLEAMGSDDFFTLLLPGGAQWSVDRRMFDGSPRLAWTRSDDRITLTLQDARLPATGVRCDFTLNATRSRGSWQAHFAFPWMNATGIVSLEDWIVGRQALLASAQLLASDVQAAGFSVRFGGRAAMRFSRDWNFTFLGQEIAALSLNGEHSTCDELELSLREFDETSLAAGSRWRTIAEFAQGGVVHLIPDAGDVALLDCPGACSLHSEFSWSASGAVQVASLWSAEGSPGMLEVLTDTADPEVLRVPVDSLRIAQLHSRHEPARALFAGVREGKHWQEMGSASVQLVAQADAMVSSESQAGTSRPAQMRRTRVDAFVVPFIGADSATFRRRGEGNKEEMPSSAADLKDDFSFFTQTIELDAFDFVVSRISDGFAGTFRFRNLELRSRRGDWFLAPAAKCKREKCVSLLEFELASQHLQEEALFSASPPGISDPRDEILCTPYATPDARTLAYVASHAKDSWDIPASFPTLRLLLERFFEKLEDLLTKKVAEQALPNRPDPDLVLVKEMRGGKKVWPQGADRLLSPAWLRVMKSAAVTPTNRDLWQELKAPADREFKDLEFPKDWHPKAVDAQPTRLIFRVSLPKGSDEVPFDLTTITEWAVPADKRRKRALEFVEQLSRRALATDASVEEQERRKPDGEPLGSIAMDSEEPVTSIALPYRLEISPILPGRNETAPLVRWGLGGEARRGWGGAHALWHLRLGETDARPVPFRALHSPDFKKDEFFRPPSPFPNHPGKEFRASLDAHDRHNIVGLSSGFGYEALLGSASVIPRKNTVTDKDYGLFVPLPFHVLRMLLTPMGSTFDLLGKWSPPGSKNGALTVQRWGHSARIRRDTDVPVEYKGFLLPLGIPAVLVKRTTREFKRLPNKDDKNKGSYRAVMVQRFTIRVEPKAMNYPALDQSFEGRDWCFRSLTVEPAETPPLLPPGEGIGGIGCSGESYGRQAFWPLVPPGPQTRSCTDGNLFEFRMVAGACEFMAPLVFVDNEIAHTPSKIADVLKGYVLEVLKRRKELENDPQKDFPLAKALARMTKGEIEYVPGSASRNTRHLTPWFVLGLRLPSPHQEDPTDDEHYRREYLQFNAERERRNQPPFYPRIAGAVLESRLLAGLTGNVAARYTVDYHPTYVAQAFDSTDNAGAVFLRFVKRGAPLNFGGNTSASGGAMSPSTVIAAISRDHGPVGGKRVLEPSSRELMCVAGSLRWADARSLAMSKSVTRALGQKSGSSMSSKEPQEETDPVAKFLKGTSDPMEYFGEMLGDAKLLGCVRLVDIIKTALQVTGTQVPRIQQEELFDGILDVIRPIVLDAGGTALEGLKIFRGRIDSRNSPAAVRAKLTPSLTGAVNALEAARTELQQAVPRATQVASHATAAAGHLRRFGEDAQALAEDPASLLPPAAVEVVANAKRLLDAFEEVRRFMDNLPEALRIALLGEVRARTAELRNALQVVVQQQVDAASAAAYGVVAEWLQQLSDAQAELERAISDAALQKATTALRAIADRVAQFDGWVVLAERQATDLMSRFNQACKDVLDPIADEEKKKIAKALIEQAHKKLVKAQAELQTKVIEKYEVRQALKHLGDNAPDVRLARVIVQSLEQLSALERFIAAVNVPADGKLRVRLVIEALQKAQGLARKGVEVAQALRELEDSLAQAKVEIALPVPPTVAIEVFAPLFRVLQLGRSVEQAAKAIEQAQSQAVGQLKAESVKILTAAATELLRIQDTAAAEFEKAKLEFVETAQRQLSLFLSAMLDSPELRAAAQAWQSAVAKAQTALAVMRERTCDVIAAIPVPVSDPVLSRQLIEKLASIRMQLNEVSSSCTTEPLTLQGASAILRGLGGLEQTVRELVITVSNAVEGGDLGTLLNGRKIVDDLLAELGLPTRLRISYGWDTDIEEFPRGGGAVFRPVKGLGSGPGKQPRLGIDSRTEIDLRNGGAPTTVVNGYVDAFDLHLFGTAPFLIVKLEPVKFTSGSGIPLKLDVRVKDVAFGQALKFVDDLAKYFGGDSGVYVKPNFRPFGIEVGYRFNKDVLQLAALTLKNVSLSVAIVLPFDNSPTSIRLAVGTRQKPVEASVGTYGGCFFVAMQMRADSMELLEASMEYGLVTNVDFGGIVTGTAKITAGIYIALGARDEITGFFNASGAFSVAHLMTVGASLVVSLRKMGAEMQGDAEYTFEFSLGIIDYSYSVNVAYMKGGSADMSQPADQGSGSGSGGNRATASAQSAYSATAPAPVDAGRPPRGLGVTQLKSSQVETAEKDVEAVRREKLYQLSIRDEANKEESPKRSRLTRGLADMTVWSAYWEAFSDLDELSSEMCTSTKS